MWPGTGRLVRTRMYGLTEREIIGHDDPQRPSLIDQLKSDDPEAIALPTTRPDLRDYIEAAYDALLTRRYITDSIPAWSNNHINRLTKAAKRYVVDGALMAAALGATVAVGGGHIVGAFSPMSMISQALKKSATWAKSIRPDLPDQCQLPDDDQIPDSTRIISRPRRGKIQRPLRRGAPGPDRRSSQGAISIDYIVLTS